MITTADKTWYPPKDLDAKETIAYTADGLTVYLLYYFYAALMLVGTEILPSDYGEMITALVLIFATTIFIGIVIGEFASILASITKKERVKTEEADIVHSVMLSLRLPEQLQDRILEYYDKMSEAAYIQNSSVYKLLSPSLSDSVKLFQTNK